MENVELGKLFIEKGENVYLYGGKDTLHFRMYPEGLKDLGQGWAKSFASGSQSSHPLIIFGISLWIAAAFISFIAPLYFLWQAQYLALALSLMGYLIFSFLFYRMSRFAGNFQAGASLIYPVFFIYFVGLFAWSFIQTFILKRVSWKGRDINLN